MEGEIDYFRLCDAFYAENEFSCIMARAKQVLFRYESRANIGLCKPEQLNTSQLDNIQRKIGQVYRNLIFKQHFPRRPRQNTFSVPADPNDFIQLVTTYNNDENEHFISGAARKVDGVLKNKNWSLAKRKFATELLQGFF